MLGDAGERWGEGYSVEDMVKVRRVGWEELQVGRGNVKRARERDCARRYLMEKCHSRVRSAYDCACLDHPIPLSDSAKINSVDSYPNMPYTVKL